MLVAFAWFASSIASIIAGISHCDRLTAARSWARVTGEVSSARVMVHYDPQSPADAALEIPDTSPAPLLFIIARVALSAVGAYKWWHLE